MAYLLAADASAAGPFAPEEWDLLKSAIQAGLVAYVSRVPGAAGQGSVPGDAAGAEETFAEAMETARGRGLKSLFAVVPLAPLLQAVRARTPEAEAPRLHAEACASIAKMFPIAGSVLPLSRNRVGILLCSQTAPDPDLVLHQVSSGLSRLYAGIGNLPLKAERVLDPASGDFRLGDLLRTGQEGS